MPLKSIWPLLTSVSLFFFLMSFYFSIINLKVGYLVGITIIILSSFMWFRDLIRESMIFGFHNLFMQSSLKLGMIFFILSEIFFFISFFWTFFHFMFSQNSEMGAVWPPLGVVAINYKSVPLLNTLLLLSSGVSLTISHNYLCLNMKSFKNFLLYTVFLGIIFSYCQYWEYKMLDFIWSDSCFSSIFYMGTGFHGCHVIIGSLILLSVFIRSLAKSVIFDSMIFELGAWYWHFVDVVWIILFVEFYWW